MELCSKMETEIIGGDLTEKKLLSCAGSAVVEA